MFTRRNFTKLILTAPMISALPAVAQDRLTVVATTSMLADLVRAIGQDLVDVKGLMGPGVDPHSYRHTPSAIMSMTQADLTIRHGLELEMQMASFFEKLERRRPVIAATNGIDTGSLLPYAVGSDRFDPHVWMDPNLWIEVAQTVANELIQRLPDQSAKLQASLDAYNQELVALDAYARTCFQTIPTESRVLVTAHDAFGYLGKAYGIEVIGIQGISTNAEAGVFRITELVDVLVKRNIQAVFVESSVSSRNLQALIEGAAAQGHTLALGGELFSDAMGAEGTYEGTYLGMIDHNITTITRALGGEAPETGRLGKLGH